MGDGKYVERKRDDVYSSDSFDLKSDELGRQGYLFPGAGQITEDQEGETGELEKSVDQGHELFTGKPMSNGDEQRRLIE